MKIVLSIPSSHAVPGTVSVFVYFPSCEGSFCSKHIDLAFSPDPSVLSVRSHCRLTKFSKAQVCSIDRIFNVELTVSPRKATTASCTTDEP